jgi:hypothetical protein
VVDAHKQAFTHSYHIAYPAHPAREATPHYKDFHAYHKKTRATALCAIGERIGFQTCKDASGVKAVPNDDGYQSGLELHHAHIEFALQNGVTLEALEHDYPGVSNKNEIGAWVETGANLIWYCAAHHRGVGGAHSASHSDFEAAHYIRGLIE